MTLPTATSIWKRLLIEGYKVVTSEDVMRIASKFGKDERRSLSYLQEHGYIFRILRGIFYVKSPEEVEGNFFKYSIFEMISEALRIKGVKNWYFGLETALKMNLMTHEFYTVDSAITDSFRTTKAIGILDSKFVFRKWAMTDPPAEWKMKRITDHGCALYISDKERTVLDLAYRNYIDKEDLKQVLAPLIEFEEQLDRKKIVEYLSSYPPKFREAMIDGSVLQGHRQDRRSQKDRRH